MTIIPLVRTKSSWAKVASAMLRAERAPARFRRWSISRASRASLEVKLGLPSLTRLPPRLVTMASKSQAWGSVTKMKPLAWRVVRALAVSSNSFQFLGALSPLARKASRL